MSGAISLDVAVGFDWKLPSSGENIVNLKTIPTSMYVCLSLKRNSKHCAVSKALNKPDG
jgi:hypothetical protein